MHGKLVIIRPQNVLSGADTPLRGVSALLVPARCTLIFASQCPTPQSGVGHWGGGEKLGVRGQERFKNRLPYSAGTASAFFELPSAIFSFTGVAGKAGDARNLCGAACARSELCSFCYAEKHCRFCRYKPKCFYPHSRRRERGKRSEPQVYFVAICLRNSFSSWIRRRAAYPRCFFRDALSHLKAMPAAVKRRIHTKRVGLKNMRR